MYDKLVAKVNGIGTSGFVLKTKYDTEKSELENKIPDTSGLFKKTDYDTKVTEIEGKIPDISNLATKTEITTIENKIPSVSNLATKTALMTVENKIPDINNLATKTTLTNTVPNISTLIKKSDYDTKIAEIENKYVSNAWFSSKLAQANVITKRNFQEKIIDLEKNIKRNTNDSSYFKGKSHFEEDGVQNYLVFQPMYRYFKVITNTNYVSSWKSKGLSAEIIKQPTTYDNSLTPALNYYGTKTRVKLYWKLFKTIKNFIYSRKSTKYLRYLWIRCI